ncbi:MAG: hypothetical protein H7222_12935 [Methylotenera sp.]|nr:hypothetical protein [Oligoflexia bacterium]
MITASLLLQAASLLLSLSVFAQTARPVNRSPGFSPVTTLTEDEQKKVTVLQADLQKQAEKRAQLLQDLKKMTQAPDSTSERDLLSPLPGSLTLPKLYKENPSDPRNAARQAELENRTSGAESIRRKIKDLDSIVSEKRGKLEVNQQGHPVSAGARTLIAKIDLELESAAGELKFEEKKLSAAEGYDKKEFQLSIKDLHRKMRELKNQREELLAGKVSEKDVELELIIQHVSDLAKMHPATSLSGDSTAVTDTRNKSLYEAPADSTNGSRPVSSGARGLSNDRH